MKYGWSLLLLLFLLGACASPTASLRPANTTEDVASWQIEVPVEKSITGCGASDVYFFSLAIDQSGNWQGEAKIRNTDRQRYRDKWNNRIAVAFNNGDEELGVLPIFDETMPARSVKQYTKSGEWDMAPKLYAKLKFADATLIHECQGIIEE